MDPMPSQNPLDLMFTHISESLGHQPSCPSGKAGGRSLIQHRQDASFRLLVLASRRSLPRHILEAFSPLLGKAGAPLADAGLSRSQAKGHFPVRLPFSQRQDHTCTLGQSLLNPARLGPRFQNSVLPKNVVHLVQQRVIESLSQFYSPVSFRP